MHRYYSFIALFNFLIMVFGILVGTIPNVNIHNLIICLSIIILICLPCSKKIPLAIPLSGLFLMLGLFRTAEARSEKRTLFTLGARLEGKIIQVSGSVVSSVNRERGGRYLVRTAVTGAGSLNFLSFYVYSNDRAMLKPGEGMTITGEFMPYEGKRNPGGLDWKKFYGRKGIAGRIYARDAPIIPNPDLDSGHEIIIGNVHTGLKTIIGEYTDNLTGGLVLALLVGDRINVDPHLSRNFINAGVIHVLALSGLHVGYVILILLLFAKILRVPWGLDRIFMILGLFVFIIITGGKPSVVRGVIMASCYLITPILRIRTNTWNPLGLSGMILLLLDPNYIFEAGFQYSFLAVASIFLFYPVFQKTRVYHFLEGHRWKFIKYSGQLFFVSLAAQTGTIPVTIFLYHKIPLAGFIANLFVIPLIGGFVSLSMAMIIFSGVDLIAEPIGNSLWLLYQFLDLITGILGNLSFSNILTGEASKAVFFLAVAIPVIILLRQLIKLKYSLTFLLLIVPFLFNQHFRTSGINDVLFIDVGQGDATLLRTKSEVILVDTGPGTRTWNSGASIIVPALQYLGISRITRLILTHDHLDHTGGTSGILEGLQVDTVYFNRRGNDPEWVRVTADRYGVPVANIFRNKTIITEDGYRLTVVYPLPETMSSTRNKNNQSVVIWTDLLEGGLLLTGDLELPGFRKLFQLEPALRASYLKLSHHGSYTGTTVEILERINPKNIVIPVGKNNKFNHPSESVLHILDSLKITYKRTDREGAIWFKSDGKRTWNHPWR